MILGSGEHRYKVVEKWAQLPEGWEFKDVAAVACDRQDRVHVFNRGEHPNLGPRLSIVDREGKLIARLGGEHGPGLESGRFIAPHGLAVDSRGDIYVGEVSYTEFARLYPERSIAFRMRSLQKLVKVARKEDPQ
jgi:hypothetical protein